MNGPSEDEKVQLDPTVDFIAGTIAGMGGLIVGFPFDTVKVRFQSPQIAGKYRTTFHAFSTIMREEQFAGLYKGITSPLATCALMNGLVFASYRFWLKVQLESDKDIPTIAQVALAGAGSGIVSSIITTPTELIKIRQQSLLTSSSSAPSARMVALEIFRQHGIRGLYRGFSATALRDCGYGAYFAAYEATCRYFTPPSASHHTAGHSPALPELDTEVSTVPLSALLLAGAVAGVAGWLATFPLDVVKTRIQGSEGGRFALLPAPMEGTQLVDTTIVRQEDNPYRTTWSTIVHSYRTEGIRVFYRGLAPTLIRAMPVNMATFAVFEGVVHGLS